ncbi:MAG: hypothetical protein ACJAYB_000022 [Psychromonas sp.]|jgi:hypothetical protein
MSNVKSKTAIEPKNKRLKPSFLVYDLEELALSAIGMNETQMVDAINENVDLDELLFDKWGIEMEAFCAVATALLPITPITQTAITKELIHAFIRKDSSGRGLIAISQPAHKKIKHEI